MASTQRRRYAGQPAQGGCRPLSPVILRGSARTRRPLWESVWMPKVLSIQIESGSDNKPAKVGRRMAVRIVQASREFGHESGRYQFVPEWYGEASRRSHVPAALRRRTASEATSRLWPAARQRCPGRRGWPMFPRIEGRRPTRHRGHAHQHGHIRSLPAAIRVEFVQNEKAQSLGCLHQRSSFVGPGQDQLQHHVVREQDVGRIGHDPLFLLVLLLSRVPFKGDGPTAVRDSRDPGTSSVRPTGCWPGHSSGTRRSPGCHVPAHCAVHGPRQGQCSEALPEPVPVVRT